MSAETGKAKKGHSDDHGGAKDAATVKVTVFAPRFSKGRKFTWDKNLTVGAAAQEAATAFEYAQGNFTLENDRVALDRGKTLGAAEVEDKDELGLVDTGGGV
jgi:hypothetical protein